MSLGTGLVFDDSMSEYHCLWDPTYVEKPERFLRILKRFRELGLVSRCVNLKPRMATKEELLTNHSENLLQIMKDSEDKDSTNPDDVDKLKELSSKYDCIYIHPKSYQAALLSAGSALELTDAVINKKIRNGFALIRPPGHHATFDELCGYCYFNNVALCAKMALKKGLTRILIVDWDVHHGQGTQRAFYEDSRVLYFSIHRYEYGSFWPELRESDFDYIGKGVGKGFNVNVPLNTIGNTDSEYLAAFTKVLMPMATEFDPELVLVSAGFDPALGCIEGEQEVTPACFAQMTNLLMSLANGNVVALLEGGYFLTSLAESAAHTLKVLLGDPCPLLPKSISDPCEKTMGEAITNVISVLRPYWTCFQDEIFDKDLNKFEIKWLGPTGERPTTFDPMCPTPMRNTKIDEEFEKQMELLIQNTDLNFSEVKLSLNGCNLKKMYPCIWHILDQVSLLDDESLTAEDDKDELLFDEDIRSIIQMVDHVMLNKSQSGICLIKEERQIDELQSHTFTLLETKYEAEDFLSFFFEDTSSDRSCLIIGMKREGKFTTATLHIKESLLDHKTLMFSQLFDVILPMGYVRQPSLVLLHVDFSNELFSRGILPQFLHCLSGLANGKIVVCLKSSSRPLNDFKRFSEVVNTLMKIRNKSVRGIK